MLPFSLKKQSKIVIKVGSSILTDANGAPDFSAFDRIVNQIHHFLESEHKVILVSSGAIACGMYQMNLKRKPSQISQKQAIAAIGQIFLMNSYQSVCSKLNLRIAQLLLTRDDLSNRERYLNIRHTLHELLNMGVVPIINENDTVAVEEIKFGDNDNLAALVTTASESDLLIILTDQEGLYTADPRFNPDAKKIPVVENLDQLDRSLAGDTARAGTTGGMITKLQAAEKAALYGVPTIITSGKNNSVLSILKEEPCGTIILPKVPSERLSRRKHWMSFTLRSEGSLIVDAGAEKSLVDKGKSLLPSGILKVVGSFEKGEAVDIGREGEKPFARGLTGYSSAEIEKIKGGQSSEIESKLGYRYFDEVIHRDDLTLL